jgi:hypothetical protein
MRPLKPKNPKWRWSKNRRQIDLTKNAVSIAAKARALGVSPSRILKDTWH